MYKVWIGNRESERLTYNIFNESITFYGSNTCSNNAFSTDIRIPNRYTSDFKNYVIKKIEHIIHNYSKVQFHFYNPIFAHRILKDKPELVNYFVNINEYEILKWITSKTFVRQWLSNSISVPAYSLLSKSECSISNLTTIFCGYSEFIIQKDISGGGEGTYLLTYFSENEVLEELKDESLYLVSPYYSPKTSVCCHMLIGKNNIAVFPFGIQTSEIYDNKLLYKGTSYPNILGFNKNIEHELFIKAISIGYRLQKLGYKGICGLDFILHKGGTFFIEVNTRYLGSTFLINKALKNKGLPSLFELNTECFDDEKTLPCETIRNLKIGYASNVTKSKSQLSANELQDIIKKNHNNNLVKIYFDGLENTCEVLKDTYLYRGIYQCKTLDG